jgi:hypothetical protein
MHLAWYYGVLIVALALLFGWICATLADSARHSGLGFGILGFFAFIIVFMISYAIALALPA